MHYYDQKHLENNHIIITIYIHECSGFKRKDKTDWQLCSIQESFYFPPDLTKKLIKNPHKFLKKIKGLPLLLNHEEYIQIRLRADVDGVEFINMEIVTHHKDGFKQIH